MSDPVTAAGLEQVRLPELSRAGGAASASGAATPGWTGTASRSAPVRVSKIGKVRKILQIFGGLVLGCIKTKFCKKIISKYAFDSVF